MDAAEAAPARRKGLPAVSIPVLLKCLADALMKAAGDEGALVMDVVIKANPGHSGTADGHG